MPDITLYSHIGGPNGWKVAIFLEELGVSYQTIYRVYGGGADGVKHPQFLELNPNGRIPVIVDHRNDDFVLWESAAIIEYLVDRYDTKGLFETSGNQKYEVSQWLAFQISGQGPNFGQAVWFASSHPEQLPTVIERFSEEMKRILNVLERHLEKTGQPYLTGENITVADLAFLPWNMTAMKYLSQLGLSAETDIPHVFRWHTRCAGRESVKKVYAERDLLRAKQKTPQ